MALGSTVVFFFSKSVNVISCREASIGFLIHFDISDTSISWIWHQVLHIIKNVMLLNNYRLWNHPWFRLEGIYVWLNCFIWPLDVLRLHHRRL